MAIMIFYLFDKKNVELNNEGTQGHAHDTWTCLLILVVTFNDLMKELARRFSIIHWGHEEQADMLHP